MKAKPYSAFTNTIKPSSTLSLACLSLLIFSTLAFNSKAQVNGGINAFPVLITPTNAFTAGVGGVNNSNYHEDPNVIFTNPASLNAEMANRAAFSISPFFKNATLSSAAYGFQFKPDWFIGSMVNYISYGNMQLTDPAGTQQGSFTPNDFVITTAIAHKYGPFSLGANLKFAGQGIERYRQNALASDIGVIFVNPNNALRIGFSVHNIGFAFSNYTTAEQLPLPFDVRLGLTYKLQHMPLRFSITGHRLHKWDIVYNDPNYATAFDAAGNPVSEKTGVGDMILRHFTLGGEFLLGKSIIIRAGYNHLINRELKLDEVSGGAGLSYGALIKYKWVDFGLTRMRWHSAAANTYITFVVDFNKLVKKDNSSPAYNPNPS